MEDKEGTRASEIKLRMYLFNLLFQEREGGKFLLKRNCECDKTCAAAAVTGHLAFGHGAPPRQEPLTTETPSTRKQHLLAVVDYFYFVCTL